MYSLISSLEISTWKIQENDICNKCILGNDVLFICERIRGLIKGVMGYDRSSSFMINLADKPRLWLKSWLIGLGNVELSLWDNRILLLPVVIVCFAFVQFVCMENLLLVDC